MKKMGRIVYRRSRHGDFETFARLRLWLWTNLLMVLW